MVRFLIQLRSIFHSSSKLLVHEQGQAVEPQQGGQAHQPNSAQVIHPGLSVVKRGRTKMKDRKPESENFGKLLESSKARLSFWHLEIVAFGGAIE